MALVIVDGTYDSAPPPGIPGGAAVGSFMTANGPLYIYVFDDIDASGDWGYASGGGRLVPEFPVMSNPITATFDDANGRVRVCVDGLPDNADCFLIERSTDQIAWSPIRGGACAVPPVGGLSVNGVGSFAQTPDDASLDILGDIDIRVDMTPSGLWASGVFITPVSKWNQDGVNQRSYALQVANGGQLQIVWSTDGTSGGSLSAQSTVAVPVAAGRLAIRVVLDVDNGAAGRNITFFTAPNMEGPWTQLGTTIVQGGTTSIFNSNAPLQVTGHSGAGSGADPIPYLVHAVQVRNLIGGSIVAFPVFWNDAPTGATFFTDVTGHTWTVFGNASIQHREVCINDYEFTPCVTNYYRATVQPRGLYGTGDTGNYASTPDATVLDVTGDIDLRADVSLVDWTPPSNQALVSKRGASGQRSYMLEVTSTGGLLLIWSNDGTANVSANSTATLGALVSDGNRLAVRATLDVDNGAAGNTTTFYTAPTIAGPWTQLGVPVIQAGTTSIFNSTAPLEAGSFNAGQSDLMGGVIHAVQVFNGINGTAVANANFANQTDGVPFFTDSAGLVWTMNGQTRIYGVQLTNTSVFPQLTKIWLKSVTRPFLNIAIPADCSTMGVIGTNPIEYLEPLSSVSRPARTGVFPIVNRTFPIAVNDIRLGRSWNISLRTWNTLALKRVDFLLASGDVILIQVPDGCIGCAETIEDGYVTVADASYARHHRYRQRAVWDMAVQEVVPPGPDIVYAESTWQTVINQYGSWDAVLAAFPSWTALLAILPNPSEVIVP